jgi:hypothetical protein
MTTTSDIINANRVGCNLTRTFINAHPTSNPNVSPIWVIMLSSVEEAQRGKQMGYVYFAWLLGLLSK